MEIASITAILAPLAFLACPVGMGLMMWMMARGNKSGQEPARQAPTNPPSVEVLREEHRRLGDEIARLEQGQQQPSKAESGEPR